MRGLSSRPTAASGRLVGRANPSTGAHDAACRMSAVPEESDT
jgi:hypothetical protein